MLISELLDPKIDYVFKRIFGFTGNEEITQGLIISILRKDVSNVELDCETILEKDLLDDKVGIMDIRARIDNKINCNIEMQIIDKKNIEKRILFYWSKLYNSSIKSGEDYDQLEKGIVILISDYELESLKEIRKYITKWNIREEDYQKIILTDALEFYIIELPKFEKYQDKIDNKKAIMIEDRKSAIESGIELLNNHDTLLILGKGNEQSIFKGLGKEFYKGDKHYAIHYLNKRKEEENEII